MIKLKWTPRKKSVTNENNNNFLPYSYYFIGLTTYTFFESHERKKVRARLALLEKKEQEEIAECTHKPAKGNKPKKVSNRKENLVDNTQKVLCGNYTLDMRHIQYQGETLPPSPFPLVLAFHLVLGKFHIYLILTRSLPQKKPTFTAKNH